MKKEAEPCAPPKAPYTVKITNLFVLNSIFTFVFDTAWDQSENFVKIYLPLKDVHENPSENVQVEFRDR